MNNYKLNKFNNLIDKKSENIQSNEIKIMKLDSSSKPSVSEFSFHKLTAPGEGGYQFIKKKYGPLAATDSGHTKRQGKDARFKINPLLRTPLSIDEEEKRAIEEKVRTRVAAVSEEAKENALAEGYQEGLKKGYEESLQKFREVGVDKINRFEKFIQECEQAKFDIFRANEKFLIELIYRVARKLILKDLAVDPEYTLRLSRELIEKVGVKENVTIRINEKDFEIAQQLKEGLEQDIGALKNLNIEVTNLVQMGGCMVDTDWNAIDAAIETQLQGLHETLLGEKNLNEGGL